MSSYLTNNEVEEEIARLTISEAVRLARKEQRLMYRRRQRLYSLRSLEKRGNFLMQNGITMKNIADEMFGGEEDEVDA